MIAPSALVLVDGGLPLALPEGFDVVEAEDALFEPLLERYRQRFATREEHRAVLEGAPRDGRPRPVERRRAGALRRRGRGDRRRARSWRVNLDSLKVDVLDTLRGDTRTVVERVGCPIGFVWAERGLMDEPVGYYTLDTVHEWRDRLGMHVVEGHDQNHYTLMLRDDGAGARRRRAAADASRVSSRQRSCVHRRTAVGPRLGGLELRRDAEQHVFAAGRGDELHADRQAGRRPASRAPTSRAGPVMLNGAVKTANGSAPTSAPLTSSPLHARRCAAAARPSSA